MVYIPYQPLFLLITSAFLIPTYMCSISLPSLSIQYNIIHILQTAGNNTCLYSVWEKTSVLHVYCVRHCICGVLYMYTLILSHVYICLPFSSPVFPPEYTSSISQWPSPLFLPPSQLDSKFLPVRREPGKL